MGRGENYLEPDSLRIRPSAEPKVEVNPTGRAPGMYVGNNGKNTPSYFADKEAFLRMCGQGMEMKECARVLGRSVGALSRWMRTDPEFLPRLKELNVHMYERIDAQIKARAEEVVTRINKASDEALDKLLDLMDHADSEVVQMRCAQDLLDRNPDTSKTKKIEKTTKTLHLSAEFLHLVETSEREAGTTIDG